MRDRIGKFDILRLLGKGAMGEVYLGRDPLLGREVAIKVIHQDSAFGPEAKARFAREAQAAASLSHPNVITVYEFGEDDGLHFLAMEYLQGEDLESLIRSGSRSKPQLLEAFLQVCEGLEYAHERGIIHRDIKPNNIFVTRHGHRSTAKLMDFGIAQMGSAGLTEEGTWMGTVSYMAPEYLDSGRAAASSDLFAMGVVLYEILSGGRRPFEGDSPTMVLNSILRKPPTPLDPADLKDLGARMLSVVDRALNKDPQARFADAGALARAIAEALSGEAGPAPATAPEPARPEPSEAPKTLLRVGRGGQGMYLSLRVALRNAAPGSLIQVLPGVYRESLVVDKDVRIVAEGTAAETIVDGGREAALVLRAPGATIQGLSFRSERSEGATVELLQGAPVLEGCRFEGGAEACLRVGTGVRPRFKDCEMRSAARIGVEVAEAAQVLVECCSLEGFQDAGLALGPAAQCQALGLRAGPAPGVGIRVGSGGQARMEDCEVSGAAAGGVEVEPGGSAELARCRLSGSRFAGVLVHGHGRATLSECELAGHDGAGIHLQPGASAVLQRCRITHNDGYGASVLREAQASIEGSEFSSNGLAGLLVRHGATAQVRNSRFFDGRSTGIACAEGGQAALDSCEISGNAGAGARVEPGGSLLLAHCTLCDGRDSGLLLLQDARATLEACVVQHNARGGILLAKDAADPELRGANRIEDELLREGSDGGRTRAAPAPRR